MGPPIDFYLEFTTSQRLHSNSITATYYYHKYKQTLQTNTFVFLCNIIFCCLDNTYIHVIRSIRIHWKIEKWFFTGMWTSDSEWFSITRFPRTLEKISTDFFSLSMFHGRPIQMKKVQRVFKLRQVWCSIFTNFSIWMAWPCELYMWCPYLSFFVEIHLTENVIFNSENHTHSGPGHMSKRCLWRSNGVGFGMPVSNFPANSAKMLFLRTWLGQRFSGNFSPTMI